MAFVRYLATAAAFGPLWFVVLLIPKSTRVELLLPPVRNIVARLVLLTAVSIILAIAFRRFIVRANGLLQDAIVAAMIPLVGTYVFELSNMFWMLPNAHPQDSAFTLHGFIALPIWAVWVVTISAFYVVFPTGYLAQQVMKRVGRNIWPDRSPADRGGTNGSDSTPFADDSR